MSLNNPPQTLQSFLSYWQGTAEKESFNNILNGRTKPKNPPITFFWERFGADQVSNVMTKARDEQPMPAFAQWFNFNNKRQIAGVDISQKPSCCQGCRKLGNEPFTCTVSPDLGRTPCKPNRWGKTQLYLYNDQYLCCAESPFSLDTIKQPIHKARAFRDGQSINGLTEPRMFDPAVGANFQRAQNVFGSSYYCKHGRVSTRVSTS